ncbi:MAG TPA: energy transducer TonB [Acetobacteraceae bacterium]|nr:energy transducer TonB [Acetobacteraceae bacterium]
MEGHHITPPGPDETWHNSPPVFPREAALLGEHGTVEVLIHVGPDGRATGVDVIKSSGWPVLDRAVLDAARDWHFQPGQRDGVPVASELPFRVVFSRGRQ